MPAAAAAAAAALLLELSRTEHYDNTTEYDAHNLYGFAT
jgi:hypothetical protein